MRPIIELKDVWKTYKMGDVEVHALRGMNFQVKPGEFVAIMGPSGSGKSTGLNLVGCLDTPSKGIILLDGRDISKMRESELAKVRGKKIGFIFQKFNLIETLSAKENVMLPMMFQNTPFETREKKAIELLDMFELKDRMNHRPNELSGGQQQRVAIARSLANDPEVILADEPTGNLDSKSGENVLKFLEDMHTKKKLTIVMVTHDVDVAKKAQRIEHLKDGMVIKSRKGDKK